MPGINVRTRSFVPLCNYSVVLCVLVWFEAPLETQVQQIGMGNSRVKVHQTKLEGHWAITLNKSVEEDTLEISYSD